MKKMIWLTIIFVLGLVFVVPAILSIGLKMIPVNTQPGFNNDIRASIYRDRVFVQKFTAKENNLTAIGMSIRNPNLKNKKDIVFNLLNLDGSIIRGVTINGMNLEDGSFTKFVFDPIPDSAGKEYLFTISSPAAGPEETIELFIIGVDNPSGIVEYSYMKEAFPGGTSIVQYVKPVSKLTTVKEVYTNLLSRFLPHHSQKSL